MGFPGRKVTEDTLTQKHAKELVKGSAKGQIIKMGTGTVSGGTAAAVVTDTVTFTEAFPTACDFADVVVTDVPTGYICSGAVVTAKSTTGLTIGIHVSTAPATAADISYQWIAIGH